MKNLILSVAIFVTTLVSAQKVSLEVSMVGFASDKGKVYVGLYKSQESFLKKSYKGTIAPISKKTANITFDNLEPGEYAVSIYHDENSNQKLDTNFIGIPKEAYGTSNGAKGFMGPPKYSDAKFILTADKKIIINLNN